MTKLTIICTVLGATALWAIPASVNLSSKSLISLDRAEARIGRPGTPMSVAGVNRRAHRRGHYGGAGAAAVGAAAVGAAAAGTYYNRSHCGTYGAPPCY